MHTFLRSHLQFSKDVLTGRYPVNAIEFAIQVTALMSQVSESSLVALVSKHVTVFT